MVKSEDTDKWIETLAKLAFPIDGIQPQMPTLLISECCLCYLSDEEATRVLKSFCHFIPNLAVALYEPTNPIDDFGKMMISNLNARGLSMPTVHAYPTLDDQKSRLRNIGFAHGQEAADVDWLWENWITPEEKQRVNSLEMMDEIEEWQLLARHYSVVWAWQEANPGNRAIKSWGRRLPGMQNRREPAAPLPDDDEDIDADLIDENMSTPTKEDHMTEEDKMELVGEAPRPSVSRQ